MKTFLYALGSTGVYAVGAGIVCCRVNRHASRSVIWLGRHRRTTSRPGGVK